MVDIVDTATRSRMMSGIRSKNTKPELFVRKKLFREGFRYRIHVNSLPGKPDLVFPKYKSIIFVHGCFWHGHQACKLFKVPATRNEFWINKFAKNRENDTSVIRQLRDAGWRVAIVWECEIRNKANAENHLIPALSDWIKGNSPIFEIGLSQP